MPPQPVTHNVLVLVLLVLLVLLLVLLHQLCLRSRRFLVSGPVVTVCRA